MAVFETNVIELVCKATIVGQIIIHDGVEVTISNVNYDPLVNSMILQGTGNESPTPLEHKWKFRMDENFDFKDTNTSKILPTKKIKGKRTR